MSDEHSDHDPDRRRPVESVALEPGQTLGSYRILKPLGRGGMGEVLLAEDTRLERAVALKLLPPDVADNPERRARFAREAKAVAALSHPNIVTVHSIEEIGGKHVITMEYVDGKSLAESIPRQGMSLSAFLDLAIPLADAVAAAHRKGITHRDLKPANVMVGGDGRPKILDFGLVKLREETAAPDADNVPRTETMQTGAGVILGTPFYMSPEQAEGREVDARSDVFSLGIVLYEMATGERPFRGETGISVISSIVRDMPPSVTDLNRALPRQLGRIIKRCLAKDPTRRYETALGLRNDLEELKQELDSGELLAPGGPPAGSRLGRWRFVLPAATGAVIVLAAVLGYLAIRRGETVEHTAGAAREVSFQRLTEAAGSEDQPSLSPDGKWFVYRSDASGGGDIYLQAVGGANPINLTPDSPDRDSQPAFSPDGERIAFRSERDGGGIFVMGRTGESVRRLTDDGYFPAWSPDGKEIAYSTVHFETPAMRSGIGELWAVDSETGEARRITEGDAVQPHWSPSGRRIAYWGVHQGSGRRDIWTVAARGGSPVPVTDDPHLDWNPLWSPDGTRLYFASDRGGAMNLWRVAIDEESGRTTGPLEPVTIPAQELGSMAISAAGERIAYTANTWNSNIQKIAFDPSRGVVEGDPIWVTQGLNEIAVPCLSPDGEWITYFGWGEQEDIFVVRKDGSGRRRLTHDLHKDRAPRWSPDGEEIVFFSDRSGSYEIWTIRPDGSGLRQLTDTPGVSTRAPDWSPDGSRMVVFMDDAPYLFETGAAWDRQTPLALPLLEVEGASVGALYWSPDGQRLAGPVVGDRHGVVVYSLATRSYRRLTDDQGWPGWTRDGRALLFSSRRTGGVRRIDVETGESRELLPAERNVEYYVAGTSPDDRWIYLLRLEGQSDIWLVDLGEHPEGG